MATAAVTMMQWLHGTAGTWKHAVNRFLTPSEFARQKLIEGGLPAEKITTKGNFVIDSPAPGNGESGTFLFVGRLSEEKGLRLLIDVWNDNSISTPLRIAGSGPMEDEVKQRIANNPNIEFVGRKSPAEVFQLMGESIATIVPSTWYETFGMVVTESFAMGTPAIVSHLGALSELVEPGKTGLLFQRGDPQSLYQAIQELLASDTNQMRKRCYDAYLKQHTAEANLKKLETIYHETIVQHQAAES